MRKRRERKGERKRCSEGWHQTAHRRIEREIELERGEG